MSLFFTSIPAKRLAESITGSATSFKLTDIEGWDGVDLVTGDFGTQAFGVFRDANGTLLELFSFDPATIASSNIDFVDRGLEFSGDLTTEVAANKLTWPRGTIVQLGSNPPQFFQWLKEYIDAAAIAGGVPATTSVAGLSKLGTTAQINAGTSGDGTYGYIPTPDQLLLSNYARGTNYENYAADAGASDAYAITVTPTPTAYATGQVFVFKAATANTGPATLQVGALAAIAIKKNKTVDLETGDILAGQIVSVVYDATTGTFMLLTLNDRSVKVLNAGETLNGVTLPVPVYQNTSDNELYACDGNDTSKLKFIGFVTSNSTDANPITLRTAGVIGGFSSLDEGVAYYLSDTVGTIQNTPGTYAVMVGVAVSTTELLIINGKRYDSGAATITGTATSSITCGFRPIKVIIFAALVSNNGGASSQGSYVSGSNRSTYQFFDGNTSDGLATNVDASYAWHVVTAVSGSAESNSHKGIVDTLSGTGFRLNQTKTGGSDVAISVYWIAEGDF